MIKKDKENAEKKPFKTLKDIFYAVGVIHKNAPGLFAYTVVEITAYWFFTGFIQDILFLRTILQVFENGGDFREFVKKVLFFTCINLAYQAIMSASGYFRNIREKHFYKNLNNKIFDKATEMDIACYENSEIYDKYTRATEIITASRASNFSYSLACIFAGSFTAIFVLVYVATIDPKMLLLLFVALPVVLIQSFKSKTEVKADKEMTYHRRSKSYVKRIMYMREYSKDMRTSGVYEVMHKRYALATERLRGIIKEYGVKMAFYECCTALFSEALPVVCAYGYATYKYAVEKSILLSDFSVIMTAMSNLKDVVNDLSYSISEVKKQSMYFVNFKDFTEYENTVVNGDKIPEDFRSLEFKNVTFTYPGSEKPTLKNLNLMFKRGETTAVVGQNGAGKTTFVKLLLRFYDPEEGEILYNGINIKEYDLDLFRPKIATVFQDYKVFALTVAENAMCKDVNTWDDKEKVHSALKKSGADSFVKKLSQGEDTVITREFDDNGTGLSGGEKQKLAVARIFCKDFDLAVLDEPSSALDPVAEYKMYESLIEATRNKTVVYISHRLSSAVLSDKIYVFDGGTVTESGTHNDLMALGGLYAQMFTLQASSYKKAERSVSEE